MDMEKCTKVTETCLLVPLIREKLTDQADTFLKMGSTTKDNSRTTKPKHPKVTITLINSNIEVDSRTTLSTGTVPRREENTSMKVPTVTENESKEFSSGILFPITMSINTSTKENSIRKANSTEKVNFKRSREPTKDNSTMGRSTEKERINTLAKSSLLEITSKD
jgi:hypothetical protein